MDFIELPDTKEETPEPKKKSGIGKGILIGILLAAALIVGGTVGFCKITGTTIVIGGNNASKVEYSQVLDEEAVDKIDELTSYLNLQYYEEVDEETLKENMYKGLMNGLGDPYSVYYSAEEYAEMQVSTTGEYYGIGAGLSQNLETMEVTITKVYGGTPSEEAGLKNGDILISVEDIDATSMEVSKLVQYIRGEEGTTVHLTVYRPSTEETLEFDVERRNVTLPSIEGELLENNIGYIQIAEFQTNTAVQFKEMLQDLENQGMQSLIIDVRSNPGGLITSVVDILDTILPKGTVVYTEDKYGNRNDYTSDSSCLNCPLVVLVDGNSASASEIFGGAIKDYEYGTLVGTTTYGKGIVQTIYPLSDGDAVKLTTAKYFTPNGNYIHEVGIDPDVVLEYEFTGPEDGEYEKQYDNQLQKAIEMLNTAENEQAE